MNCYFIVFRPPKFDYDAALQQINVKKRHRFLHRQKLLEGFVHPPNEIHHVDETTTLTTPEPNFEASYLDTIEELKDLGVTVTKQDIEEELAQEIDYEDFSGEMDYADYM